MRRTLSWLVAGALVSGIGGASFADSEDSLTPLQDPPKMTIGNLQQVFIDGTESLTSPTSVNRILPSASLETVRDGFRSNATATDVGNGTLFPEDYDEDDSVDFVRVAPQGNNFGLRANFSERKSPIYTQEVTVTTNGPTESIERVGYCLINMEDSEVQDDDTNFKWYDTVDADETNDIERHCGFNDDYPTSTGTPDNDRAVISIIYDVENNTFEKQGTSQHQVPVVTEGEQFPRPDRAEASWDGQTLTVSFAFKPSHALMKQSSGWVIRAAAQDQPIAGGDPYPKQVSQIFWGNTEQTEGEVNSNDASRSSWTFASVGYYGAIVSVRSSVNYGPLKKDEEKVVTGITSGRYLANSESELLIQASDFTPPGSGVQSLRYGNDSNNLDEIEVAYRCSYDPDDTSMSDSDLVNVGASVFAETLDITIDQGDPEDSKAMDAISCSLKYGGGAAEAGTEYSNRVIISIRDKGALVPPVME